MADDIRVAPQPSVMPEGAVCCDYCHLPGVRMSDNYYHRTDAERESCGRAFNATLSLKERVDALENSLRRLRDCDWIISLPDRMDAVRDIARAALAAPSGVTPKEKV